MKKLSFLIGVFLFFGCEVENAPACFKSSGEIISEEIEVSAFEEIQVYQGIKLFVQQGEEYRVEVKTGKNLLSQVLVEVEGDRLLIKNQNSCNLFRGQTATQVYVTTPSLTWLQNSSEFAVESIDTLKFPELWLRSFNQERDPEVYTNGDFILDLELGKLRITNDNLSNYYLSGKVGLLDLFFAAGDGRLEAAELKAENVDLMHRGTNKLILNPQQSIKGNIYGFGDVILKNRPAHVQVEEHYTGKLIFDTP